MVEMARLWSSRGMRVFILLLCLAPGAYLAWRWQQNRLGINSVEFVSRYTGDWVLRFLILTLVVTPLRKLPGMSGLIGYRRWFGLCAFYYGCLHIANYFWRDKAFFWPEIIEDFTIRRFFIAGAIGFTLMIPLAVTSSAAAIRWMGGKRWQLMHRLVYVSAIAGVVHFHWQNKSYLLDPLIYAAIVALLLLFRLVMWALRRFNLRPQAVPQPLTRGR